MEQGYAAAGAEEGGGAGAKAGAEEGAGPSGDCGAGPGGDDGALGPEQRTEAEQGRRVVERSRGGGGRRGEGGGNGAAAGRSRGSPEQGRVEEEASAASRYLAIWGARGVSPAT